MLGYKLLTKIILLKEKKKLCFIASGWFVAAGLAAPQGMWDLSSPTKDRTHVPSIEGQILNRWIAREVPPSHFNARSLSQGNDAQELVA